MSEAVCTHGLGSQMGALPTEGSLPQKAAASHSVQETWMGHQEQQTLLPDPSTCMQAPQAAEDRREEHEAG